MARRFSAGDVLSFTKELLEDLYWEAGVSPAHIELLTGRGARAVRQHMRAHRIAMRRGGELSPATRRFRQEGQW